MTPKSIFPGLALSPEFQTHISKLHFNIPQATKAQHFENENHSFFFSLKCHLLWYFLPQLKFADFTHDIYLKSVPFFLSLLPTS